MLLRFWQFTLIQDTLDKNYFKLKVKILLQVVLGIIFVPFFVLFLLSTTLKFQLLNYSFIVDSFDRNHVYDKVEGFSKAVRTESKGETDINLTPKLAKEIVETNLKEILSYANGKSADILLSIPGEEKTPLSKLAPHFPKQQLVYIHRLGTYSLIAWIVSLILILVIAFFLNRIYLIIFSLVFIILGILARFFLIQMARDLVKGNEPSQHLLAMLASSILPEIVNTWIFIAAVLGIVAAFVLIFKKFKLLKVL